MRTDVDPTNIETAVVKAIYATFDRTKWMELGLETAPWITSATTLACCEA